MARIRDLSSLGIALSILWLLQQAFLSALATSDGLQKITEEELKQYDGTDPDKPIYLAIDGTIFDVSASPTFYGPRGMYHHFVGKDATRAWVTECWGSEDQLTWRMDHVETMFMPRYLDEQVENTAAGVSDIEGAEAYGKEELAGMADVILGKLGKVSKKESEKRRMADEKEAKQSVRDRVEHWSGFFRQNSKYAVVGSVVKDKKKPKPPPICENAMKKRPMKGGKLDDLMKKAGQKGGAFDGKKNPSPKDMPEFLKQAMKEQKDGQQKADDKDRDEL